VADGEPGQLWIKDDSCAVADITVDGSTSFGADGWVTTKDMLIRKNGVYYMVGRKDDTFKVNGQFVSVLKIEDKVRDIPGVADAVVAPDFDQTGLARVKVYVVTEQGHTDAEEIKQAVYHLNQDLYAHERPREVEFIDEIPRHPGSMKVQRYKLNPMYKQAVAA
jgi:acetyl-CoA synthetase